MKMDFRFTFEHFIWPDRKLGQISIKYVNQDFVSSTLSQLIEYWSSSWEDVFEMTISLSEPRGKKVLNPLSLDDDYHDYYFAISSRTCLNL